MSQKDFIKDYPRLVALTVSIRVKGVLHVNVNELAAKLGPEKAQIFNNIFGIGQTCPIIEGEAYNALYPWDVEAVLERMESGRLTGTQLFWD